MDGHSSIAFEGQSAELRYGYHVAARLGKWSIGVDRVLVARIVEKHPVWIMQPSLTLAVRASTRRLADVVINGSVVTARVLPGSPHAPHART